MTLSGLAIAIGMIVDGTIVVVENSMNDSTFEEDFEGNSWAIVNSYERSVFGLELSQTSSSAIVAHSNSFPSIDELLIVNSDSIVTIFVLSI
jgi:hypothetical protein